MTGVSGAPEDAPKTRIDRCTGRLMWITLDRIFYAGLLGSLGVRAMGSLMVYVATEGRIRISMDRGSWQDGEIAVVHPYQPHRLQSDAAHIYLIKVEAETTDLRALPSLLATPGTADAPWFVQQVRTRHRELCGASATRDVAGLDFDQFFFGEPLPQRKLDRRIEKVVESIKRDPAATSDALSCAALAHLSFSRFLHLFKQEVGVPFRTFRTWKRARGVLHHVASGTNLAHVALDTGYSDSAHFSHCIKSVYGLQPRQIFAGSRKLTVHSVY